MAKSTSSRNQSQQPSSDGPEDFSAEDAKGYLSRLLESVGLQPLPTLSGVCTQVDNYFVSIRKPAAPEPPGPDPLLGYSVIGRMCGRSPQTIRRWVLEGLMQSEVERAGAPRRVRLSVVKKFFSAGNLNLREVEEIINAHNVPIRREGETGSSVVNDQP